LNKVNIVDCQASVMEKNMTVIIAPICL